jgi:hypothetical protein
MMFEPNNRVLLTQAFRAPAGYQFDCGLATTYTLDLTTLLGATLHLSLFGEEGAAEDLKNGIALLEALRRTSVRLHVFCQAGRISVPKMAHVLYGLLEPMVIPVTAPLGGVFHPKLWALRFTSPRASDSILLRVLVLSRNLTNDRCWDVALAIDGTPTGMNRRDNEGLREFVSGLPQLASNISDETRQQIALLAAELHSAKWRLPDGFDQIRFDVLGLRPRKWRLPENQRLAVISPFCTIEGLNALARSSADPVLLISRPEELDKLIGPAHRQFSQCKVLREAAETEDGEDTAAQAGALHGLHAKVYIAQDGWDTRITMGSPNATTAALVDCHNVELLTELSGRRSKVGSIDDLLSPRGLGNILEEYTPDTPLLEDENTIEARRRLEEARKTLSVGDLRLLCHGERDCWGLTLKAATPINFSGVAGIAAWPISLRPEHAVDASGLGRGQAVQLTTCSLASVTGFVAFEITASRAPEQCCFVLNLPVEGLPAERRAAVVRTIVANREGFLKYLLFLLADLEEDGLPNELLLAISGGGQSRGYSLQEALPLLEEMTRALSRNPDRLHSIRSLIEDLTRTHEGLEMVPEDFMELWKTYASMLQEVRQ